MPNALDLQYLRERNRALREEGARERWLNSVVAEHPSPLRRLSRVLRGVALRLGRLRLDAGDMTRPGGTTLFSRSREIRARGGVENRPASGTSSLPDIGAMR
jgi:hypothetical protein